MKMLRFVYNKLFPAFFLLLILFAFDSPFMAVLTLLAALLHELGHIATASVLFNHNISMPKAVIYGLRIDTGSTLSYNEEFFTALGGPAANLLAFFAFIPLFHLSEYAATFALINLFTAVSNLLPLRSYDGQRMLSALISKYASPFLAQQATHCTSLALSTLGCFISLFLVERMGEGYWIFGAFFASFLNEIFVHSRKAQAQ